MATHDYIDIGYYIKTHNSVSAAKKTKKDTRHTSVHLLVL